MLHSFKRWMGRDRPEPVDWSEVIDWAAARQLEFRRERDDRGFVIEGRAGEHAWRMEWGPPQRHYLQGHELRLRCEAGLPADLQMLLISAALGESLEREAFSRFTEQAQTEVDVALPEEMRWLALFRRVPLGRWRGLRGRLDAVAATPPAVEAWLEDGEFVRRLERALGPVATDGAEAPLLLADDPSEATGDAATTAEAPPGGLQPLVLMTLRGRLYLRTELAEPHLPTLDLARRLFEGALLGLPAPVALVRARSASRRGAPAGLAEDDSAFDESDEGVSTAWQTRAAVGAADDESSGSEADPPALDPDPTGR